MRRTPDADRGREAPPAAAEPVEVRGRRVEGAPVVAVRVWLRGGSRHEEIAGQALLSGRLLTEGTRRRGWRQIAEESEALGMAVSGFAGLDLQGLSVDALASDWERALDWAAELALESSFPAERCSWVRRQAAGELAALADDPDAVTGWAFLEQLYAPHPAARPLQGTVAALERLAGADWSAAHRRALGAGLIVTVAGRVETERVRRRAEELFAGASADPGRLQEPPAALGLPQPRRAVRLPPGDQAHLFLGRLTVPRGHADAAALRILGVILGSGSGLSGRLVRRLREREGLAYVAHVDTLSGAGFDPGRLVVYVGTSPDKVETAIGAVREELTRVLEGGVTDDEVEEARSYLLGREPFRRETARQWAEVLAAAALYRLPLDRPEWVRERLLEVGRRDVAAAAAAYLRPEDLRITVGVPDRPPERATL